MTAKQALIATAAAIDESTSWEEAYAQLELRRKIDASEAAVKRGEWVTNDEILAEIDQWIQDTP
jgi:predicted transcriptional regulator